MVLFRDNNQRIPAAIFLAMCSALCCLGYDPVSKRAAGGKGPELRSRVTNAISIYERMAQQDPSNGTVWWLLGVEIQASFCLQSYSLMDFPGE